MVKTGRQNLYVFEKDKTYKISVETYGYGKAEMIYKAVDGPVLEEKKPEEKGSIASAPVVGFGYNVELKLNMEGDKIKTIDPSSTKVTNESQNFYKTYIEGKALDKYLGKTLEEVKNSEVQIVSGATATSKAAHEAILSGLK